MIRGRWFGALAGLAAFAGPLLLAACAKLPEIPQAAGVEKTFGSDASGRFTMRLSQESLRAAEDLSLRIEARAAAGWSTSLPDVGDSLGAFTVLDRGPESRVLAPDGALTLSRTLVLEPFLAGQYTIPSFTVTFEDRNGRLYTVVSSEIPVEVTSVLPPQVGDQELEAMGGPLGMQSRRPLWFGLGAAFFLTAGTVAAVRLRRGAPTRDRALTAAQAAMLDLDRLVGARLAEAGRHQEFYQAISDIARRYVEARYSVHAPRRTTEEFLEEAARHASLREHASLLQGFLSACDLVKFARHAPTGEEVGLAVGACRTFITETAVEKPA